MTAKTLAQRQAAYRERHSRTKSRINLLVANEVRSNLYRLADRYGLTETATLERIIKNAYDEVKDKAA